MHKALSIIIINLKLSVMKKISVLLAVVCVLCLIVGTSNAQNGKEVVLNETVPWVGVVDCVDEVLIGEDTNVITVWNNKVQWRSKGEYIGEESGKKYTWSLVQNRSWKDMVEGMQFNWTNNGVSVLECEGVPVAISKLRDKLTRNAKGEIVVDRYDFSPWECL